MPIDWLTVGAALLTGLMGGVHCVAMCGGIATGFSAMGATGSWKRALEPNIGRIAGYTLAGALAGGLGYGIVGLARSDWMLLASRMLVGLVLVVAALRLLDPHGRGRKPMRPCGLSTTLLAAAWLQADARNGALTMAAFGLGTLPLMLPLTWSGARLGQRLQRSGWRAAAGSLVMASGLLTLAAPWMLHAPAMHAWLAMLGCRSLS